MKIDCLLAGVGGQGTVLASRLIAQTAIDLGYEAHTSEVIGMAQRGGSVTSQVRLGGNGVGPMIPLGHADLLIGFEPAEAARNFAYLKNGGTVVVNTNPLEPVTSLINHDYKLSEILAWLQKQAGRCICIDGKALCAKAGSGKVLNVLMLGILAKEGLLPFTKEQILATILVHVPEKHRKLNEKAFNIGYAYKDANGETL